MSQRYQGGFLTASYFPLKVPDAPTIGTATGGDASASVTFTAPLNVGGGAITGYTVTSSPGGFTGTGASSPITVSGLSNGTAYTFTVVATNVYGTSAASSASNSVTPAIIVTGQDAYTTAGTFSWVAPANVTSVSAVCVGAGSGGWGGSVSVNGGQSYFVSTSTVRAFGGGTPASSTSIGIGGSGGTGDGGGNGGDSSLPSPNNSGGGGGGAGGYSGAGGNASSTSPASAGSGGGAGGGCGINTTGDDGGAGGGVGILGQGASGAGGTSPPFSNSGGKGGSGGFNGNPAQTGSTGAAYGGGGGGFGGGVRGPGGGGGELRYKNNISVTPGTSYTVVVGASITTGYLGGVGAVRIIYPGTTRSFPSTNTGNL